MAALRAQKKALRTTILASRSSITTVQSQSERIAQAIIQSPEFTRAKNVSCFISLAGEVDTSRIIASILEQGKHLFIPRTDKKTSTLEMLRIYSQEDLESIKPGMWGLREPPTEYQDGVRQNAMVEGLDLILMPGVAFDRSFSRLGYGKGYYDRFIASYVAHHTPQKPFLLGLALQEHVLDKGIVPVGDYDWSVDAIASPVTDESILRKALVA